MKVSELAGSALDCWVARAEGYRVIPAPCDPQGCWVDDGADPFPYHPSSDPRVGYEIIDRVRIATWRGANNWRAIHPAAMPSGYSGEDFYIDIAEGDGEFFGESLLVAAMRAYVASEFGDEVQDVPPAQA